MKTTIKIIGAAALISLFAACKPRVDTVTVQVTPLKESSLYNADDVYKYLAKYQDTNKELANEYYEKGLHWWQNSEGAIYFYKRSLSLYPMQARYRELGGLLYRNNHYREMNELYHMFVYRFTDPSLHISEYLFGKPDEETVENYVVSNILAYNTVWNSLAEQKTLTDSLGISMNDIKGNILQDNRIKLSKPTEENRNVLWAFLTSDEKMQYYKDNSVDSVASHLEDSSTVFDIDKNGVKQFIYREFIESRGGGDAENVYDKYNDFVPENVKESWNHDFERHIKMNDSVEILVYALDSSATACPKDMRCVYHVLETYYEGYYRIPTHMIDSKLVAVQAGEQLSTVKFDHNKFTITNYKRSWEKPFDRSNFDNHISKEEETGQDSYVITPAGKIKKMSGSSGDKAAL